MQRSFGEALEALSTDCSICLEDFRLPRLLPCGHTFCTRCLQQLVGELQSTNPVFKQQFCCPLCRKVLAVPAGGVQNFPSDVLMVEAFARRTAMERISTGNNTRTPKRNVAPGRSIRTKVRRTTTSFFLKGLYIMGCCLKIKAQQ